MHQMAPFLSMPPKTRGSTLIFSYICRLGSFFGVQNFEFQYFWGFQKKKYFLGYEDFVDIFWGHHKIGLYFGLFLCILWSFLKVIVQSGNIFLGC